MMLVRYANVKCGKPLKVETSLHPPNHPTKTINIPPPIATVYQKQKKAIAKSSAPILMNQPATITEEDAIVKDKEIDKLMALISLSFKKIYKPTNNNLRTSSNTSRANQDNSPRINRGTGYDNQRAINVVGARENVGTLVVQNSGIQCYNYKEYRHVSREYQKPKRDDTDDESDDQELEALYMYMAQLQEVTPDHVDNSRPIFDDEPMHKVQNNNDNYNVFAMENEHPEQPESSNDIYLAEHGDTNITIDSLDICYDSVQDDQDETDDLDQERDLLASLIQKLKCEIDDSKNRNKFLESSNKELVDKLKGEIEDFKTKNKSLESSNNHFKEANNELSKTNQLMFKDLKKFQAELDKYNDVKYASKVEIDYAKAKRELMSYKINFEKSSNAYTQKINDLNQTISDMKKELCAHQETIFIMSQAKEAHIKLYKTREDKELDKVTALENKVKVLNDIVYKTGQSVQIMNMLNRNCKMSFAKPEFLKKAQRANPRLYDIGCYNDNLALMLAPESDETIRFDKESRSKLRDLIRPFDYDKLNNIYDLFFPQREKSAEQHYFPKTYLSPVKDIIKMHMRILRAWLQPLYNNQQFKNMEMIVMDEHNTKMQAIVRMDKPNRFKHYLKEGNALTIQRYSLGEIKQKFRMVYNAMRLNFLSNTEVDSYVVGQVIACEDLDNYDKNRKAGKKPVTLIDDDKMCIQNGYWGTKLYLFDGNKAISEDEYKEVEEFRQRLFANQPSEQSENIAMKISTASKNSTKDNFVNRHPIRNIVELLDVEHGVQSVIVGTVIAIQEAEGWWPNDWWCRKCNARVALIKSQFRLQIRVQDETGTMLWHPIKFRILSFIKVADDANIRPFYDEEPMTEVQLTAECNIFAIGQQHTEQPEIINEGRVDQYPEKCQVKSPILDSSLC
ncbi:ribonuclease H-like domain-containing protein [Tanacetum coccineum]